MADMKLTVYTQGGDSRHIEASADIRASELVRELVNQLGFPNRDLEGNPVAWRLDDKDLVKTLDLEKTLEQNGVQSGHRLSLIRQTTAG